MALVGLLILQWQAAESGAALRRDDLGGRLPVWEGGPTDANCRGPTPWLHGGGNWQAAESGAALLRDDLVGRLLKYQRVGQLKQAAGPRA